MLSITLWLSSSLSEWFHSPLRNIVREHFLTFTTFCEHFSGDLGWKSVHRRCSLRASEYCWGYGILGRRWTLSSSICSWGEHFQKLDGIGKLSSSIGSYAFQHTQYDSLFVRYSIGMVYESNIDLTPYLFKFLRFKVHTYIIRVQYEHPAINP